MQREGDYLNIFWATGLAAVAEAKDAWMKYKAAGSTEM